MTSPMDTSALLFGADLGLLLAVLSDATWDDSCRVAPSQLQPDGTNIRINMRLLAMRERHLRRSLPSHEAKDEDQHKTGAHGEREQWASPSYRRWHHHGCVYKERCKRATEGETVGVLLAKGEVQQAAQAGLGAQTLLNNPTREPSAQQGTAPSRLRLASGPEREIHCEQKWRLDAASGGESDDGPACAAICCQDAELLTVATAPPVVSQRTGRVHCIASRRAARLSVEMPPFCRAAWLIEMHV
jgi:hypothetical protein